MKADGDVNVSVLNGWNTHTYRVETQHLRERIAMSTVWFTVLSTSQYLPLDGALVHDMSVCTVRLILAHTIIFMCLNYDFISSLSFYIWH